MAAALLSTESPVAQCLAPTNVRSLCFPIVDDFGFYISSGLAALERSSTPSFWDIARAARTQVTRALDSSALPLRSSALRSLLAANRDPQSIYEALRKRMTYRGIVSNLGRFPSDPSEALRVTAFYLFLNAELEPAIGVASAVGPMCIALTSDQPQSAQWLASFLRRFRSETLRKRK